MSSASIAVRLVVISPVTIAPWQHARHGGMTGMRRRLGVGGLSRRLAQDRPRAAQGRSIRSSAFAEPGLLHFGAAPWVVAEASLRTMISMVLRRRRLRTLDEGGFTFTAPGSATGCRAVGGGAPSFLHRRAWCNPFDRSRASTCVFLLA